MNRKLCSMLGLAMRAGKLKMGEDAVLQTVRNQTAQLVIISNDASLPTRKKMEDKCQFYQIPIRESGTREQLGACIGKHQRVLLAVMDQGFARNILSLLDQVEEVNSIEKNEG